MNFCNGSIWWLFVNNSNWEHSQIGQKWVEIGPILSAWADSGPVVAHLGYTGLACSLSRNTGTSGEQI